MTTDGTSSSPWPGSIVPDQTQKFLQRFFTLLDADDASKAEDYGRLFAEDASYYVSGISEIQGRKGKRSPPARIQRIQSVLHTLTQTCPPTQRYKINAPGRGKHGQACVMRSSVYTRPMRKAWMLSLSANSPSATEMARWSAADPRPISSSSKSMAICSSKVSRSSR